MLKNLGYPLRRIISLKKLQKVARHYGYVVNNDPMEYIISKSTNSDRDYLSDSVVGSVSKYDFNRWGTYGLDLRYPKPLISALILFKHTPLWLRFDRKNRSKTVIA